MDEQFQGLKKLGISSIRSPSNPRFQFGVASQRLRSSSSKKPPEPLRRAVADCLSTSSPSHHGHPSTVSSEAARILRDYLAAPSTTDVAYSVLLEHALSERDRRPREKTAAYPLECEEALEPAQVRPMMALAPSKTD